MRKAHTAVSIGYAQSAYADVLGAVLCAKAHTDGAFRPIGVADTAAHIRSVCVCEDTPYRFFKICLPARFIADLCGHYLA